MQQFQCSLHGTERATNAVYSWPSCGGGCVQNASCIACFTACGTWGKGGAWDKCDCPDECYPEGVIADQTIRILKDKVAPGGAAGQGGGGAVPLPTQGQSLLALTGGAGGGGG